MPRTVIDIRDDDEIVPIPVDRRTRAWLIQQAEATGQHPSEVAAAILSDVRSDDERAHGLVRPADATLN
jgi:hypothetical protein